MADDQRQESAIGEALLAGDQTALSSRMEVFESVRNSLGALRNRRDKLLTQVSHQHDELVKAQGAADSYGARQEYFRTLLHGAEELTELHAGLSEGKAFYLAIVGSLRAAAEQATTISDQRNVERDHALAAANFGRTAPSSPPSQRQSGGAPPPYDQARSMGTQGSSGALSSGAYDGYPGSSYYAQQSVAAEPNWPGEQPGQASSVPRAVARPVEPQWGGSYGGQTATARAVPVTSPPPAAAPTPAKIACYGCRRQFGVPDNTAIVACPFCGSHNRVPGK